MGTQHLQLASDARCSFHAYDGIGETPWCDFASVLEVRGSLDCMSSLGELMLRSG